MGCRLAFLTVATSICLAGCGDDGGTAPASADNNADAQGNRSALVVNGLAPGPCSETHFDDNDEVLRQTVYHYDNAGQVTAAEFALEGDGVFDDIEFYEYNEHGDRTIQRRPDGTVDNVVAYQYDSSGKILRKDVDSDGDGIVDWTYFYDYDERGRLVAETLDPESKIIEDLGIRYSDFPDSSYEYNAAGQVTRVVERDGEKDIIDIIEIAYDENGREAQWVVTEPHSEFPPLVLSFTYDEHGNRVEEVWASGSFRELLIRYSYTCWGL